VGFGRALREGWERLIPLRKVSHLIHPHWHQERGGKPTANGFFDSKFRTLIFFKYFIQWFPKSLKKA
jgi:hypothetical protein